MMVQRRLGSMLLGVEAGKVEKVGLGKRHGGYRLIAG